MSDPTTYNIITLDASAEAEVDQDVISITFATTQSGPDSQAVQANLQLFTNEALEIVRPLKKGWQVRVETSGFRVSPGYDKKGAISGYSGRSSITVYGTDMQTISGLVSSIKSMAVENIDFSVSPSKRRAIEAKLSLKAIAAFREKAETYAIAFGGDEVGTYKLITAQVHVRGGSRRPMRGAMIAASVSLSASPSFEAEGGKEELTATVNGSIQVVK